MDLPAAWVEQIQKIDWAELKEKVQDYGPALKVVKGTWSRESLKEISEGRLFVPDEEFNQSRSNINGNVTRAKGLGELDATTAHNSMFTEKYQRLEQLEYNEEAISLLYDLMGEAVLPRADFIMNNIDFSQIKE